MRMNILAADEAGIARAAAHLRNGGLVGMPTETVYGLAANARDPQAISRIFQAKGRPRFDPLIVHVPPGDPLRSLVGIASPLFGWSRRALKRLEGLLGWWPGPLTLVLPRDRSIPDLATAGLATVAVRMPAHPVTQRLLTAFGGPLVAPSANRFGRVSPTTAEAVAEELAHVDDIVLDGGPCPIGLESTIVAVEIDGTVLVLRPGAVPVEALVEKVGPVLHDGGRYTAPGSSPSHYAPRVPVRVLPYPVESVARTTGAELLTELRQQDVALLRVFGPVEPAVEALETARITVVEARTLSAEGSAEEAARRLLAVLRDLDRPGISCVLVELPPSEEGLLAAIGDRLRRAAGPRGNDTGPPEDV
jgi:L-threonylcarbamoyladenylate synthase